MSDIKIDLKPLFKKLETKSYSVIKLPNEFPDYKIGSDLDIFCCDVEDISRVVLAYLQENISKDLSVKITNMGTQIYIDLIYKDKIHFRFDMYGALPTYVNILIKEAFFSSVIENSQIIKRNGCKVKVPSKIDESILRYIEYQEWYRERPDKIKHIEYLEEKIKNSAIDVAILLDKLHYYTKLPQVEENREISSSGIVRYFSYLLNFAKKILRVIKEKGFRETLNLIIKKVKKW